MPMVAGLGHPQIAYGATGAPGSFLAPTAGSLPVGLQGIPKNVLRVGEQALWSAYQWPQGTALANTQDSEVFVTSLGSIGQGYGTKLSLAETNLRESARIPDGFSFVVLAIGVHPYYSDGQNAPSAYGISAQDLRNLQNQCVFALRFLQTTIEIAPLVLIGAGGGIFGTTADTGAVDGGDGGSRSVLNSGPGTLWVYQQIPMVLYAGVTFAAVYLFGSRAAPVDGTVGNNNSALNLRTMFVGKFDVSVVG